MTSYQRPDMRAAGVAALAMLLPGAAWADERPLIELSSWVGLGGAVERTEAGAVEGAFALTGGLDATLPVAPQGPPLRGGLWVEGSTTGGFDAVLVAGGLELFQGAVPRNFGMFSYRGEGVTSLRVGGGRLVREGGTDRTVFSATVAWGYQAPWYLWDPLRPRCLDPSCRVTARYMIGARLFASFHGHPGAAEWQATAGIEFEPVGALRYLLGLY